MLVNAISTSGGDVRSDATLRARKECQKIWQYVNEVLENEELLGDFGFSSRSTVAGVIVLLVAGDRLHPELGCDYWWSRGVCKSNEAAIIARKARNARVYDMIEKTLFELENDNLDAARSKTKTPTQVIYLCQNELQVENAIESMIGAGLYCSSMVDTDLRRAGETLVFVFGEEYSYFEFEGCEMWM